ncbi:MAG TPA: hypothetical protein VJV78_29485 [Polyangiales bacterium]|nr:hypothetical protein [Polyangiales bacterium]
MRKTILITAVLLAGCGGAGSGPGTRSGAQALAAGADVTFADGVEWPEDRGPLPIHELTAAPVPLELVNEVLDQSLPGQKLAPLQNSPLYERHNIQARDNWIGATDGQHVKAWIDVGNGETEVYPTLSQLQPFPPGLPLNFTAQVQNIAYDRGFIPRDDTMFVLGPIDRLFGTRLERSGRNTPIRITGKPEAYLVYVPISRRVMDLAVEGLGSRALIAFGANGRVAGLTRTWRVAKEIGSVAPRFTSAQLRLEIERQLSDPSLHATVDKVRLVYYDGNRKLLQPAYRFNARVWNKQALDAPPVFLAGYLAYGDTTEPIPSLLGRGLPSIPTIPNVPGSPGTVPKAIAPPSPGQKQAQVPAMMQLGGALPTRTVGRYLARGTTQVFIDSAEALWTALQASPAATSFSGGPPVRIDPAAFASGASAINMVQLALVDAHGTPGTILTNSQCCDPVAIETLRFQNADGSPAGELNDWIIHSCEVVESFVDSPARWDQRWWGVFARARNVVGYRTRIISNDLAMTAYGARLGLGSPIVSTWLSTVMSLREYEVDRFTRGTDQKSHPVGRPSTVSVCGHDEDSALDDFTAAPPDCLINWWVGDVRPPRPATP